MARSKDSLYHVLIGISILINLYFLHTILCACNTNNTSSNQRSRSSNLYNSKRNSPVKSVDSEKQVVLQAVSTVAPLPPAALATDISTAPVPTRVRSEGKTVSRPGKFEEKEEPKEYMRGTVATAMPESKGYLNRDISTYPLAEEFCNDWLVADRFKRANLGWGAHSDKTSNTHNLHSYEVMYEKYLGHYLCTEEYENQKQIKLFEIGVGPSGMLRSLFLYKNYFGPRLEYYAIELEDQRDLIKKSDKFSEREKEYILSHVMFKGDQNSISDLRTCSHKWGPFDIVVDDGSHVGNMQVTSFKYLFLNAVAPGGVYIIEDLQTNFHPRFYGSKERQKRKEHAVQMIQDLVRQLSFHWWLNPDFSKKRTYSRREPFGRAGEENLDVGTGGERKRTIEDESDQHIWNKPLHPEGINKYEQEMRDDLLHFEPAIMDWIASIDCDREICAIRKRLTRLKHVELKAV